jgi:nicotinate-nucleotide adenylyltransferase
MDLKLAIFGGTFDPIHSAHLTVAREAVRRFGLDRVLFVPAAHPPHKPDAGTRYEDRLRMVQLACEGEPLFEASDIESGSGKSYSIDTIERLRSSLPAGDQLYFIIGTDAFAEILTWHRAADVIRLVDFIVVTRPGHDYAIPPGARVLRLDTLVLTVSSSGIRSKLAAGAHPAELPDKVFEYIRANGLYT